MGFELEIQLARPNPVTFPKKDMEMANRHMRNTHHESLGKRKSKPH